MLCLVRTAEFPPDCEGIEKDSGQLRELSKSREASNARSDTTPVKDVKADEIWAFVGMKEKNKKGEKAFDNELGDCYCWGSNSA